MTEKASEDRLAAIGRAAVLDDIWRRLEYLRSQANNTREASDE
ncbi:MAG TPA: hypothetical protein VM075_00755 [Anaerolineae bacterium]|nr:hypothetical protein [Anaerolineae bacterium]